MRYFLIFLIFLFSKSLFGQDAIGMTEREIRAAYPEFNFKTRLDTINGYELKFLTYTNNNLPYTVEHLINLEDKCVLTLFILENENIINKTVQLFNENYVVISDKKWIKYTTNHVIAIELTVKDEMYAFQFKETQYTTNPSTISPKPKDYSGVIDAPFSGKIRKDAKTSVATGRTYSFDTVSEFLAWLPTDGYMYKLGIGNNTLRTKDENYNIEIKEASIIRIELENDNDIHITICDWENEYTPINILTVEVSGLPDETSSSFNELSRSRTQFYQEFPFFATRKTATYKTQSKSPKITLTGSLFFDHYHHREGKGDKYKTNTSFEIHPITKIERID